MLKTKGLLILVALFSCIDSFAQSPTPSSSVHLSIAPYRLAFDYDYHFKSAETKHAVELGFIVFSDAYNGFIRFDYSTNIYYLFEALYLHRMVGKTNATNARIGLGYRTPRNESDLNKEYGYIPVVLELNYPFFDGALNARFRSTSLVGGVSQLRTIPSLGIGLNF